LITNRLNAQAKNYSRKIQLIINELSKVIVGQKNILKKLIIALISDGHILLEGVPGLAKTLMIKTLADAVNTSFSRIQFTPDLLPADIIGTKIYNHKKGSFSTEKGPIFNNFILADEINRAPPKVQSSLLEAMQERQVSIHGNTFSIERPFLVLATQNPIETEGTYRLPEAQVDRFAMKLLIDYPTINDEKEIIKRNTKGIKLSANKVLSANEIINLQKFCKNIYCDETIENYVTKLIDATRRPGNYGLKNYEGMIEYGASPRASIWLIMTSKAHALINGRGYVAPLDVKAMAHDVLRHRVIMTYEAEAEKISSDKFIDDLLLKVKSP